MVRSRISPQPIWLRKTELSDEALFLILRVRSNINMVIVADNNKEESHTEYEYDETEIRYQVPEGVSTIAQIKELLSAKRDNIIQKASYQKAWREIEQKPIEELRKSMHIL